VVERDSPSGAQYFVASVTVGSPAALVWTVALSPPGNPSIASLRSSSVIAANNDLQLC